MSQNLILVPVLAQIALIIGLAVALGLARSQSMREQRKQPNDMALANDEDWRPAARKISRNYKSQFEIPVLFFVLCGFALALRIVDAWFLTAAIVFVLSRLVHTAIHVGPNTVMPRFYAFAIGIVSVTLMWAIILIRIFEAGI